MAFWIFIFLVRHLQGPSFRCRRRSPLVHSLFYVLQLNATYATGKAYITYLHSKLSAKGLIDYGLSDWLDTCGTGQVLYCINGCKRYFPTSSAFGLLRVAIATQTCNHSLFLSASTFLYYVLLQLTSLFVPPRLWIPF